VRVPALRGFAGLARIDLRQRERILVAFHSGSKDLLDGYVDEVLKVDPELGLVAVSEFRPKQGEWIPFFPGRTFRQNLARIRDGLRGREVVYSALILEPGKPYWMMRLMAALQAPTRILAYNETLTHFRVHPRSIGAIVKYWRWRLRNLAYAQTHAGGWLFTTLWRIYHPLSLRRPIVYELVRLSGWLGRRKKALLPRRHIEVGTEAGLDGVSVVIPSRNGRDLLERLLPGLQRELDEIRSEIIVVDNGSTDGTESGFRGVRFVVSPEPLAFAEAANRGIAAARYRYVLLLNNDMLLERGFFPPLLAAFRSIPNLFCATAQILFPFGRRREETGKAVIPPEGKPEDFPVRCLEPVEGEDLSYVLYGSGGCSLYEARKLRALGGFSTAYQPAYVEDLDLGYRAWQQDWPTVFVAGAKVYHFHRSTTSRYYGEDELRRAVERHYLRFVAKCVSDSRTAARLWRQATWRLNLIAGREPAPNWAYATLRQGLRAFRWSEAAPNPCSDEERFLALTSGKVGVFPGRLRRGWRTVIVASCYLPFPLAHGGAVRIYNLMRQAARNYDLVLMAFRDELAPVPAELLDICAEVVQVEREGTHLRPLNDRPDVVEEFDSVAFRGALRAMTAKWDPVVVQFEFTQMAQYAGDCDGVATILVEHDITLDLYRQLQRENPSWETAQQLKRWERFERDAWNKVRRVVTMSERDRRMVEGVRTNVLENGVDLERFQPRCCEPEPGRMLFLGSFQHLPNLMALEFFLRESWPRLRGGGARLHVIAGKRHEHFLDIHRDQVRLELDQDGIEVEGFVADVRNAYARAEVVIAPLLASAGTNIKILEAMAMGKAIVTTPAGINGLDLNDGDEVLIAESGAEMAERIERVFVDAELRRDLGATARRRVERDFSWDVIGEKQDELYKELITYYRGRRSRGN